MNAYQMENPEAFDTEWEEEQDVMAELALEDDCPLDGDAASALASAGFGTDEDYEHYDAWEMDGGDIWAD